MYTDFKVNVYRFKSKIAENVEAKLAEKLVLNAKHLNKNKILSKCLHVNCKPEINVN